MTISSDIQQQQENSNDNGGNLNYDNDNYLNDGEDDEEFSSDSDYMDDEEVDDDEDDGDNLDNNKNSPKRIYVPNVSRLSPTVDNIDQLECDYSAYVMYHKAETGFPCLSFDVVEDQLGHGEQRAQTFPLSCYLVAGTQANRDHLNRVLMLKFFNMNQINVKKRKTPEKDSDDEDDDDEEEETLPDLHCASIPHLGCINRIRARRFGDRLIVANWSDHGAVHLWNLTEAFHACDGDQQRVQEFNKQNQTTKPLFSFSGHQSSGYGLDWSPVQEGALASGDCHKHIFIWKPSNSGWQVDQLPLTGHQNSVEDIQWSPNEQNILCSCSVDRSIRVWDIRQRSSSTSKSSAICIPDAHQSDVNVISWNRVEKAFILSGGDDGAIKVWDLRQVKRSATSNGTNKSSSSSTALSNGNLSSSSTSKPVATFKQHRGPITSVDWHRTDGTVFAASGEDHQVTQWDLAVEQDEDQEQQESSNKTNKTNKTMEHEEDRQALKQLPPQLLFIHQGQKEVKEIRWHPQIPGLIISTASTGFDIFRTVSV